MSKFSNILKMIDILEKEKEPIKIKELAEKIQVGERMIRKYINDLKESQIYNIESIPGSNGGIKITRAKEPEQKSKENLFTNEEIIYLKSILTLNAMDIQRELIILNESEFIPRRYEKTLKHLEKQNNIIKSIYDKINK